MADPDSPSPAEVSQREQEVVVPPAGRSEPGLNGCAPSPDTELQEQQEEEEGGADRALTKPRPPVLQLRRGADNKLIHKLKLSFITDTIDSNNDTK